MGWSDINVNPIMSEIKLPYSDINRIKKLNWKYGSSKQIQIFICIFNNKPEYYNDYQLKHIKGCNKNELYIIMSVDKNKNIQWYSVNSWTDDKALDTKVKYFLEENKQLNIKELANNIDQNIHHWKRKKGRDYKYLANKYKAENESKAMTGYNITFIILLAISFTFYIITLIEERKSFK